MDNKDFVNEYKREFDNIKASEELRSAVMDLKPQPQKRVITPFKATIGTVAAAIMIFAAVHEYRFEPDTSGVISETVASTQLPDAEFAIVEKKTSTQAPEQVKGTTVTQSPKNTVVPTAQPTEVAVTQTPLEPTDEAMSVALAMQDGSVSPRIGGESKSTPMVEMWSIEDYYNYLGVNISSRTGAKYTGTQQIEMHVADDNIPIDDTVALPYITSTGASLRITVSKAALFDSSLSGTIISTDNGFNAYKVSDGIYYNVYATNTTQEEVDSVIDAL